MIVAHQRAEVALQLDERIFGALFGVVIDGRLAPIAGVTKALHLFALFVSCRDDTFVRWHELRPPKGEKRAARKKPAKLFFLILAGK